MLTVFDSMTKKMSEAMKLKMWDEDWKREESHEGGMGNI